MVESEATVPAEMPNMLEPIAFVGQLRSGQDLTDVEFTVVVPPNGETHLTLSPIRLTNATTFLLDAWSRNDVVPCEFSLNGTSVNGNL